MAVLILLSAGSPLRADSAWLYGIHWWVYEPGQPIDDNPAIMLDCPTYGGWDVETVLTNDADWWKPSFFTTLYHDLYNNKNMTLITRIDYTWKDTVPAPGSAHYAGWPSSCVSAVNTLRNYAHIWVLGNEPNLYMDVDESDWPDRKVTPAGYATIYRNVRDAIHNSAGASPAGPHLVLVAPVSPGGVYPGVRWMAGDEWLSQTIDAIPNDEIDGFAIHSYGGSVTDFHNGYASQLAVIDGKGLQNRPVYMTEWNKVSAESEMAQFCRDAFADVNNWNQTPGNHDIVCLCWFVYASKGWDAYSIDYWRTHGEPLGSYHDLFTAFEQTVDLRYPAGTANLSPVIARFPDSFARDVYERDNLPDDQFTVQNAGLGTLEYTITDDVGWLSVNPGTGDSTGEADTITIIYDTDDLAIGGPYPALITISDPNAGNSPQTITVDVTVVPSPYAPADFNRDGDVDQDDFGHFQSCMTGANLGPPDDGCDNADLDDDGDVDQSDFGLLQRCFSGTGTPADPNCGD